MRLIGTLIICLAVRIFATMQAPDLLIYENDTIALSTFPLEDDSLFEKMHPQLFIDSGYVMSTNNYRGYVATWKIEDEKLMLVDIKTWKHTGEHPPVIDSAGTLRGNFNGIFAKQSITSLFPKRSSDATVMAKWFTGDLVTGILRWGASSNKAVSKNPRSKMIIKIKKGRVTEIKKVINQ